jgi:hypothetical protein
MTTTRGRRAAYWSGGILAAATAVTVAIHVAPVRKALGWKPLGATADATGGTKSGWCPFGFGHKDAEGNVVATPVARPHSAPDANKAVALERPALGFTLDVTTRAQVQTWASEHGVTCTPISGGATLECADVPAALLPAGENSLGLATAWFSFPFDDKLEIVKTMRHAPDAESVIAALDDEQTTLTAKAGAPVVRDGDLDAEHLAIGQLRQAHVEFQFQNYRATVRATNMGARGYMMSEMYAAVL